MGLWFAESLNAETAAMVAIVALALLAHIAKKVHLESKQNAREHAELKGAIDRLADSTDRKLDQILIYLLNRRSDKDD